MNESNSKLGIIIVILVIILVMAGMIIGLAYAFSKPKADTTVEEGKISLLFKFKDKENNIFSTYKIESLDKSFIDKGETVETSWNNLNLPYNQTFLLYGCLDTPYYYPNLNYFNTNTTKTQIEKEFNCNKVEKPTINYLGCFRENSVYNITLIINTTYFPNPVLCYDWSLGFFDARPEYIKEECQMNYTRCLESRYRDKNLYCVSELPNSYNYCGETSNLEEREIKVSYCNNIISNQSCVMGSYPVPSRLSTQALKCVTIPTIKGSYSLQFQIDNLYIQDNDYLKFWLIDREMTSISVNTFVDFENEKELWNEDILYEIKPLSNICS